MSLVLVIDTSLGACSVGLFGEQGALFAVSDPMQRGHQERIGVLAAEAFERTGVKPRDLTHVGVTLGPGSFTGLRVGLAFAKGLAAGVKLKLQGIGTLEALGHHPQLVHKSRLAVIDGGRGQIYVQRFGGVGPDTPQSRPVSMTAGDDIGFVPEVLTGPDAHMLKDQFPDAGVFEQAWPSLEALAALAHMPGHDDLTPLYMREADAIASTRGVITLQS